MSSTTLEAFLPHILVDVPECPEPVALNAIRSALIELCDTALVWRENLDPLALTPGEAVYDLDTPPQSRVATIIDVTSEQTRRIMPVDREWLFRFDPLWAQRSGRVQWYLQPDPETVQFVRVPDEPQTLFIHCAFAPSRAGTTVPSYLFEQYLETVRYGAWARLMAQPAKPWSNAQLAMVHGRMFAAAITDNQVEVTKGRVRSSTTVQSRPFA